jgi:chromosome partitioning protein
MTYIASDYIIIPTMCDESSLDAVVTTEKDIEKLVYGRHHDSHAEVLGYILSFYERTIMHQLAIESLNRLAAKKEKEPFVMTVSKSIKLSEVKTMHTALCKSDKSCKPAWDYLQIVEEIIHRVEE